MEVKNEKEINIEYPDLKDLEKEKNEMIKLEKEEIIEVTEKKVKEQMIKQAGIYSPTQTTLAPPVLPPGTAVTPTPLTEKATEKETSPKLS